ncbi:hypothetical protein BF14_026610 [Streptomyces griseus]|nr:hypothetical protein DIJ69_26660 [Streptomyces globisporus]PPA42926.1 hypothetical protein BF14_026610 [Streptomyces griseus]
MPVVVVCLHPPRAVRTRGVYPRGYARVLAAPFRSVLGPMWPRRTRVVPGLGLCAPGVRLRALTLSGCPRMLQVALRACAPQT